MSTQIYIAGSTTDTTCKPEFTKIAAHSFAVNLDNIIDTGSSLFFGGLPDNDGGFGAPIWSSEIYNYKYSFATPGIKFSEKQMAISLPNNLIKKDVLTISGTAYFNNFDIYLESGYECYFTLAVSNLNCGKMSEGMHPSYTLIAPTTFTFEKGGTLCFSTSIELNQNYDYHDVKLITGFTGSVVCISGDGNCVPPIPGNKDVVTVSYSFDVERPCFVPTSNFIIKNCCEPLITELVNAPGLIVGNTYLDDEGNCWEVISESQDVTNFTRNFIQDYKNCQLCQNNNGCPNNLIIESCCVPGIEYVTGSLPGLNVGDTFLDNNGLCWSVTGETGGPISEESITVASIVSGDCEVCTNTNPCPTFYKVSSCCGKGTEIIASTTTMYVNESFVDQDGRCWGVGDVNVQTLPTNYNIDVVTVYPYDGVNPACDACIADNTCPTEYFLTIRSCCDTDRVEVINVPAEHLNVSEGDVMMDPFKTCWEVMAINVTGIATYNFCEWDVTFVPVFENCSECINKTEGECRVLYNAIDCDGNTTLLVTPYSPSYVFGNYFYDKKSQKCLQLTGYGYPPAVGPYVYINAYFSNENGSISCDECILQAPIAKVVNLYDCCNNTTIVAIVDAPFQAGSGYSYYLYEPGQGFSNCYQLIGLNTVDSPAYTFQIYGQYVDCTECIANNNPC